VLDIIAKAIFSFVVMSGNDVLASGNTNKEYV